MLTRVVNETKTDLSAAEISRCLSALNNLTSADHCVDTLVAALNGLIGRSTSTCDLSSLCSLHGLSSDSQAVRSLLLQIAKKSKYNRCSVFDGDALRRVMYGLQKMDSKHVEVRRVLHVVLVKIKNSTCPFLIKPHTHNRGDDTCAAVDDSDSAGVHVGCGDLFLGLASMTSYTAEVSHLLGLFVSHFNSRGYGSTAAAAVGSVTDTMTMSALEVTRALVGLTTICKSMPPPPSPPLLPGVNSTPADSALVLCVRGLLTAGLAHNPLTLATDIRHSNHSHDLWQAILLFRHNNIDYMTPHLTAAVSDRLTAMRLMTGDNLNGNDVDAISRNGIVLSPKKKMSDLKKKLLDISQDVLAKKSMTSLRGVCIDGFPCDLFIKLDRKNSSSSSRVYVNVEFTDHLLPVHSFSNKLTALRDEYLFARDPPVLVIRIPTSRYFECENSDKMIVCKVFDELKQIDCL